MILGNDTIMGVSIKGAYTLIVIIIIICSNIMIDHELEHLGLLGLVICVGHHLQIGVEVTEVSVCLVVIRVLLLYDAV